MKKGRRLKAVGRRGGERVKKGRRQKGRGKDEKRQKAEG
jgi:hypothetical protein